MKRVLQDERGMALALAIVALVVVGALVAGAFFSGTQEQRMAENSRYQQQSFGVAEVGAYEVIRQWTVNRVLYNSRRTWPLDTAVQLNGVAWNPTPSHTGSYGGYVYRLNNNQYLIDVTGIDTASRAGWLVGREQARQRLGVVVRIQPLNVDVQAALTVGGPVVFGGGNVFVKGQDTPPPGWPGCGPADTTRAGVRAKSPGDVVNSSGQVTGNPDVLITPSMDSSTFINYGTANYTTLAAQANIVLPPGTYAPAPVVSGGVCQTTSQPTNWGDGNTPTNPCGTYFPIIHLTGTSTSTFTVTDGQGQGVLLVDGNLVAGGAFTFYGLVVVRGSFSTVAGGNPKIYGAVLAQSMNFSPTAFSGDAVINWSKCAMTRALQSTGVAALQRSRSWVQLY